MLRGFYFSATSSFHFLRNVIIQCSFLSICSLLNISLICVILFFYAKSLNEYISETGTISTTQFRKSFGPHTSQVPSRETRSNRQSKQYNNNNKTHTNCVGSL